MTSISSPASLLSWPYSDVSVQRSAVASRPQRAHVRRRGVPAPTTGFAPDVFLAGDFNFQSMSHAYKLYVPPASGERPSLVVMLHGCGQTADDFAVGTRMNHLARDANTAVLYPQQSLDANSHGCWNWYQEAHQQRGHGEPAWIAALTRMVAARLVADGHRIFVAGMSAGGTMAATVARAYPELFTACAVHSGLPAGAAKSVIGALWTMRCGSSAGVDARAGQTPTIVFHGEADNTVHPAHGRHGVEAALGFSKKRCASTPTHRSFADGDLVEGFGYTQRRYCASGALQAEHWQIAGLGHAWSGGDAAGSHTDIDGPDASKEFLRFFNDVATQSSRVAAAN